MIPFYSPWKHQKTNGVFGVYRMGTLTWNGFGKFAETDRSFCRYSNLISLPWIIFLLYRSELDKHQSFLQGDFNTLSIKVSYKAILPLLMGMIKYSQSTQNKKFALSLKYIKRKKLRMKFIFCFQVNMKVSTSWHYCFWWKWSDMSKVPKIGSW